MTLKTAFLAAILGCVLVIGCGKPTPEKSCARAAELSENIAEWRCVKTLKKIQKRNPETFAEVTKCIEDAKNGASVWDCLDELPRGKIDDSAGAVVYPPPQSVPPRSRYLPGSVQKLRSSSMSTPRS